jgi:AraC-like DNA-binding protein
MKIVQFTVPVANEYSVVVQEDILPFAYNFLHRHKETQITLVVKGSGTLISGNTTHAFKAGDVYVIGANQPHIFKSDPYYFKNLQDNNTHSIHVFFDHAKIFGQMQSLPELQPIFKFIDYAQNGLQVPKSHSNLAAQKVWQIKKSSNFERLVHLLQLLHSLKLNITDWKPLSTGFSTYLFPDSEGVRMNEIYKYTIDNFNKPIPLQKVASIACLTTYSFCKYFKKHTRKTYYSFLNEIRINEACKRILKGDYNSISSVAYATGFNNTTNFNRVFKKVMHKCPTNYIQEFRSKVKESG